jgi:hypothetical protein
MWRVAGVFLWLGFLLDTRAPQPGADPVEKQRATARAHWQKVFGEEPPRVEETAHLLVHAAPVTPPAKLKEIGAGLEARYSLAVKALKLDSKEDVWPSKLTVYLIGSRPQFNSFMRTIAKQRSSADYSGWFSLTDPHPFVVAGPPQAKYEPNVEGQAGDQVAAALLRKFGGDSVPAWLVAGFSRATAWRASPSGAAADRAQVKRVIRGKTAADVWNNKLSAEEAVVLRASLVEFLAYGPGSESFPQFVQAFKPGNPPAPRTIADALKVTDYAGERLTPAWHAWVARTR